MRPEIVHIGQSLYWTIRVTDAGDQPVEPTSIDVTARINNGVPSIDGIVVTSTSTGVYDVALSGAFLEGQSISIVETVVRNGKTYIHGWQATVVALERGSNSSTPSATPSTMTDLAAAPVSVSADGTSVTMPSIMDRIEADAYDKANASAKKPRRGLLFSRFTPGDAVGPRSGR
jgi:hypothetical protein